LAQCAGVGCDLVRVVVGEERARKVFSLEGPPGDGETSRLGSRDPVDDGTRCGPHGGETSKMKSWTVEPVHGGGRVKRFGGRPGRVSHLILQGKPNASHVCARINLHTHDRQNECNTIAVTKVRELNRYNIHYYTQRGGLEGPNTNDN
jgi:hypothetical protein